jgi:hypothetical protein
VHHLLLHLGGPQPCAGGHIQGAYFACPLYRSGRSPDWLKFKNPAPVKREAEEDWDLKHKARRSPSPCDAEGERDALDVRDQGQWECI